MKSPSVQYRRCHVCGNITWGEGGQRVERCYHCQKSLAPFYYFDDRFAPIQGDETLRPQLLPSEFRPLLGLTAYWENFKEPSF